MIRNSNGTYDVHYYLKDHLGNVRMVLKDDGTVLQETEYFPFGLAVPRSGTDAVNKYQYNGKEKQPETVKLSGRRRSVFPLETGGARSGADVVNKYQFLNWESSLRNSRC